jgi:hypothetical protein
MHGIGTGLAFCLYLSCARTLPYFISVTYSDVIKRHKVSNKCSEAATMYIFDFCWSAAGV